MQTSIFITDDESLARERLKRLLEPVDDYVVCGEAENGEQAIERIKSLKPDIVLLDIRMPGMDGLEVAERLNELEINPAIIFCTAYDQYAIEAFKYQAIGYLLKPARKEDLISALQKAHQVNQLQLRQLKIASDSNQHLESFVANTWQGQEIIPLDEVYYFRADQKYLTVVHQQGETISDQTLKELEQRYEGAFLRVHRNTLVNSQKIEKLCRDGEGHHYLVIKNLEEQVPVSRRHASEIKAFLSNL